MPASPQDVLKALKEISMEQPQIDLLARDILVTRIKDALPLRLAFNVNELNEEVHSFFDKARRALQSIAPDTTEVEKLIEEARALAKKVVSSKWEDLLRGRDLLKEILERSLPTHSRDLRKAFIGGVATTIKEENRIPAELVEVIRWIRT